MKTRTRFLLIAALLVLLTALIVSCGKNGTDPSGNNTAVATGNGGNATDAASEATPDAATELPATPEPTEKSLGPTGDPSLNKDGMMVYYEDFSSYGNVNRTADVVKALGWKILTVSQDGAPSDWTADLAIIDGRLYVENFVAGVLYGSDGYAMILDGDYMNNAEEYGAFTLQFDMVYTSAGDYKRYIAILTEYDAEGYNSFHFRIAGYGNNQMHYGEKWHTYDLYDDNDMYAAKKAMEKRGTTIAYKLLGIDSELNVDTAIDNFKNVPVTVRICIENGLPSIFMKTASMSEFVQVSKPSPEAGAYEYVPFLKGKAVCFKTGGSITGFVDNIAIWLGTGEMPEDHTITYYH